MLLSITDYYELLALHRIVLEAKFHSDPDDRDIADSPIAAALANQIVEALQNAETLRGKPERAGEWERLAWFSESCGPRPDHSLQRGNCGLTKLGILAIFGI
jgi:hypothetical protein